MYANIMTDGDFTESKNLSNHSFKPCLESLALNTEKTIFSQKLWKENESSFPITSIYNHSLHSSTESLLHLDPKFIQSVEYDTSKKMLSSSEHFYENWLRYFYLLVQQNNFNNIVKPFDEFRKQLQIYNSQCQMTMKTDKSKKETMFTDSQILSYMQYSTNTRSDMLMNRNSISLISKGEYHCERIDRKHEPISPHIKNSLLLKNHSAACDSCDETESLSSALIEDLINSTKASNEQTDDASLYTSSKSQRLKTLIQEKDNGTPLSDDLEDIYKFAHLFKLRRLSLGLTQTQVGASLNAKEGPAYSQSAICRFEKLDVTLKSAKRMKPVLERWLSETQAMRLNGVDDSFEAQLVHKPPRKRKRRTCFSTGALNCLLHQLERNPYPTKAEMTELAKALTYDREVIRVWFCNRRQAIKTNEKQTTLIQF